MAVTFSKATYANDYNAYREVAVYLNGHEVGVLYAGDGDMQEGWAADSGVEEAIGQELDMVSLREAKALIKRAIG